MNTKDFELNDILEAAQGFPNNGIEVVEQSKWTKENNYSDFEHRYIIFKETETGLYWRYYQHRIGSEFTEYTYEDNCEPNEDCLVECFQVEKQPKTVYVWELV